MPCGGSKILTIEILQLIKELGPADFPQGPTGKFCLRNLS